MTLTCQEEEQYWVPEAASRMGVEFWESKIPNAPKSLIMDFLRRLNKVANEVNDCFILFCQLIGMAKERN